MDDEKSSKGIFESLMPSMLSRATKPKTDMEILPRNAVSVGVSDSTKTLRRGSEGNRDPRTMLTGERDWAGPLEQQTNSRSQQQDGSGRRGSLQNGVLVESGQKSSFLTMRPATIDTLVDRVDVGGEKKGMHVKSASEPTHREPQEKDPKDGAKVPNNFRMIDYFCVVERDMENGEFWVKQVFPNARSKALGVTFPESTLLLFLENLHQERAGGANNMIVSFALPDTRNFFFFVSTAKVFANDQYICFISRVPLFVFMENALNELVYLCGANLCKHVALEPFVRCLIHEIPYPPRDRVLKLFWEREGVFKRKLTICTPRMKYLPLLDDRGMHYLFSVLDPEVILQVLEHMLAEDSVILYGPTEAMRFVYIFEALKALIYPFVWQGLYIPYLPKSEWRLLQSSSPYLVGIQSDSKSEFRLKLYSPPRFKRPKTHVLIDVLTGKMELITTREKQFVGETIPQNTVRRIPEPIRSSFLSQVAIILKNGGGGSSTSSSTFTSKPRTPTSHESTSNSSATTSLSSSSSSSTQVNTTTTIKDGVDASDKSSSDEDSSNWFGDDFMWTDFIRIAMLEVFLSLTSHLRYHLIDLADATQTQNVTNIPPQTLPSMTPTNMVPPYRQIPLKRTQSVTSKTPTSLLQQPQANQQQKKIGFDPEAFLQDLPGEFASFTKPLLQTRLFCDLVARQLGSDKSFEKLINMWRNTSVTSHKRKMSPFARKLHDLLTGLGYSLAATRAGIEKLVVLSPAEMNNLLTSPKKIKETLDLMEIPRFIVAEDTIQQTPNNLRTQKLRDILCRTKHNDKPPLVCRISLNKHHRDLPSTWKDQPEKVGQFPKLRDDLVNATTCATLPPHPIQEVIGETRSTKLTSLCLMSSTVYQATKKFPSPSVGTPRRSSFLYYHSSDDENDSEGDINEDGTEDPFDDDMDNDSVPRLGELVRVVSSASLASVSSSEVELGSVTDDEEGPKLRALMWSGSQTHIAAQDTTDTLLSHIEATETTFRHISASNQQKIQHLEKTLSEKDRKIQELEQQLAQLQGQQQRQHQKQEQPTMMMMLHEEEEDHLGLFELSCEPLKEETLSGTPSGSRRGSVDSCPESSLKPVVPEMRRRSNTAGPGLTTTQVHRPVERRHSPLFIDRRNSSDQLVIGSVIVAASPKPIRRTQSNPLLPL